MNQTTVDTEKIRNQNTREKGNQKKMNSECSIEMKSGENEIRVQHTTVDTEKYEIRIQERNEIRRK